MKRLFILLVSMLLVVLALITGLWMINRRKATVLGRREGSYEL